PRSSARFGVELFGRGLPPLREGAGRLPDRFFGFFGRGERGSEPAMPRTVPGAGPVPSAPRRLKTTEDPCRSRGPHRSKSGGVLLSQGVSSQVPSALAGLTSVFGMGTGVTPPPWPPKSFLKRERRYRRSTPRGLHSEHEHHSSIQALGRLVPVG